MTEPASAGIRAWIDAASRGHADESGFGLLARRHAPVNRVTDQRPAAPDCLELELTVE